MDLSFPVVDPVGFFVFVFVPGLIFWIIVSIFANIFTSDSSESFFKKFKLFDNKTLDRTILISFTGGILYLSSRILTTIGDNIINNHILDTIHKQAYIGMLSYCAAIILPISFYLTYRIDGKCKLLKKCKLAVYVVIIIAITSVIVVLISNFIISSPLYDIGDVSPISHNLLVINSTQDTKKIELKIALVNKLDRDIGIVGIGPPGKLLPSILEKKTGRVYNITLDAKDAKDATRIGKECYIFIRTTEGTIPVTVPTRICET